MFVRSHDISPCMHVCLASSPELVVVAEVFTISCREQDVSDDQPLAASSEILASSPGPAPACPTQHDEAREGL